MATSTSEGLLSRQLKKSLDSVQGVGGGFGIIVDPKGLIEHPNHPSGVITGDIELRSNSLDITCLSPDQVLSECPEAPRLICDHPSGGVPALGFELSEDFLSTLYVDVTGCRGKRGYQGDQGDIGEHGFSDGPQGNKGKTGPDIDETSKLTDITYNDIDGISDTAIVDLNIVDDDGHGCKLIVTRAKLDIGDGQAADKVAARRLSRTLIYDADTDPTVCDITRLDNWRLTQGRGDETPLNVWLLRLPAGSNDREGEPVGVDGSLDLESFVQAVIDEYKGRLTELDESWGREVKQYIENVDDQARSILSGLAHQLAMTEFNLPAVEYGITFTGCPPGYYPAAAEAQGQRN